MKNKKFTLLFILSLFIGTAHAQLFYNDGATVAVTGGGVLYVGGAVENAYGLLSNAGQTTVMGYFRNGSTATGGFSNGIYFVYGDWENNDIFTADQSNVILNGNAQLITGSQITTFHDLTLESGGAVKTQTLDAIVNHLLTLNDCELATKDYDMYVIDPLTAAIARNNGFVSSTGPGRLIRATTSTGTYLFPTGWNNAGNILYRPVEFTPSTTDSQAYAVRMAFGDPTAEGYDVSITAGNVTKVNTKFFHLLKQLGSSTPSAMSIYYDENADGYWGSIGRWQNVPEWEDLLGTVLTEAYPLSHRTKMDWIDNGNQPHALIDVKDSIRVFYNFPNVFNPASNDPYNSTFHIINQFNDAIVQEMRVYDRWGEAVFDGTRDGSVCNFDGQSTYCWDGKYHGKLQPMGNYVYVASVKILSTGQVKTASGNLSLLW